jgi:tight adherence protein B
MSPTDEMLLLKVGSLILAAFAVGAFAYWVYTASDSAIRKVYDNHAASLDRKCRLLYSPYNGRDVARYEILVAGFFILLAAFLEDPTLLPISILVVLLPNVWLGTLVAKRRTQLDEQLDGFLVTLANALRASPALGDAMLTTAGLMRPPIRQDLDFLLKEQKLGTALDAALANMASRVDSRSFNAALLTILVGRQTGGDLPDILDRAAASLREMARLEGVVRSKTAEGRFQAYVLAAIPFVIVLALRYVDPNWLKPLAETFLGHILMVVAATLWVGAILLARKILDVDL